MPTHFSLVPRPPESDGLGDFLGIISTLTSFANRVIASLSHVPVAILRTT